MLPTLVAVGIVVIAVLRRFSKPLDDIIRFLFYSPIFYMTIVLDQTVFKTIVM